METRDIAGLVKLGDRLGDIKTAHENLALAGNVLARPLLALRARQAALEVARAKLRHGSDSDVYARRVDQAREATLALANVGAEIARLGIQQPAADEKTVGVYGYVVDGNQPVTSGEIGLMRDNETVARTALGDDGSFSVSAASDTALTLRFAGRRAGDAKGKTVNYTDPAPLSAPGLASYRVLDLANLPASGPAGDKSSGGKSTSGTGGIAGVKVRAEAAPRPETAVAEPARPAPAAQDGAPAAAAATPALDPAAVANVPGSTLNQGLKALGDMGVAVSAIRVTPATATTPKITAVSTDPAGGAVTLDVQARDTEGAKMDVLATVLAHDPATDAVGMTSLDAARTWLKDNAVRTVDEVKALAASSVKDLRQRLEIGSKAAGEALKGALDSALGKIEHVETKGSDTNGN